MFAVAEIYESDTGVLVILEFRPNMQILFFANPLVRQQSARSRKILVKTYEDRNTTKEILYPFLPNVGVVRSATTKS
jgi:hypothetical protein